MAISGEVWQLISILTDEGFGALAGELLSEMSLGREVEGQIRVEEHTGQASELETVVRRAAIDESDQFDEALNFLRIRLVMPVRAFLEAERIASEIAQVGRTRIRFIEPNVRIEGEPLSHRDTSDASVVDQLDRLLGRLPSMRVPPSAGGE